MDNVYSNCSFPIFQSCVVTRTFTSSAPLPSIVRLSLDVGRVLGSHGVAFLKINPQNTYANGPFVLFPAL